MNDYEWLTKMGLCYRCNKTKMAPGRKFCFECLEKKRVESARQYDPKKAKEYLTRRKEIYREKKENGICVQCSKKATHGMYCYEHYIGRRRRIAKYAEIRKRERHERGLIPEKRKEAGLCLWCGEKAVNGTNVCERHREIFSQAGRKSKENDKVVRGFWNSFKSKERTGNGNRPESANS